MHHIRNVSLSAENRQHSSPVLHCYSRALSWPNARLFVDVSVPGDVALQGLNIKVVPLLPRLRSDGKGNCSSGMLSGVVW